MNIFRYSQLLFISSCVLIMSEIYFGKNASESCIKAIKINQFRLVEERALRELMNLCLKNDVNLNGNISTFGFLQRSLNNFSCSNSLSFLQVPKPLVALASYPGSGNTWTRQLIETTTGYYTGSVYTDWNFVGSKMCPKRGTVFIIKTHSKSNSSTSHTDCSNMNVNQLRYSSAICILRNPFNAILAEFNRQYSAKPTKDNSIFNSGQAVAPEYIFIRSAWRQFVTKEAERWKEMAIYWIQNKEIPVFVLVYEKLLENTFLEMSRLMIFLNFSVNYNSLYCLSSDSTRKFKRVIPQWLTVKKVYDYGLRKIVNNAIETVKGTIGSDRNLTDVFKSYYLS